MQPLAIDQLIFRAGTVKLGEQKSNGIEDIGFAITVKIRFQVLRIFIQVFDQRRYIFFIDNAVLVKIAIYSVFIKARSFYPRPDIEVAVFTARQRGEVNPVVGKVRAAGIFRKRIQPKTIACSKGYKKFLIPFYY